MKQSSKNLLRKKSNTRIISKIAFPTNIVQKGKFNLKQIQQQCKIEKEINNLIAKRSNHIKQQQNEQGDFLVNRQKSKNRSTKTKSFDKLPLDQGNLSIIDFFKQQNQQNQNKNNNKYFKHRSLTKSRSFTRQKSVTKTVYLPDNSNKCTYFKQKKLEKSIDQNRLPKQRSLTKLQNVWKQGRQMQKFIQKQKLQKHVLQKLTKDYNHLGKPKKLTKNKHKRKQELPSFQKIDHEINSISKSQFNQVSKKMSRYFVKQTTSNKKQKRQNSRIINNQDNKIMSPKKSPKKNLIKSPPRIKKQFYQHTKNYDPLVNLRLSADEQIIKQEDQSIQSSNYDEVTEKNIPRQLNLTNNGLIANVKRNTFLNMNMAPILILKKQLSQFQQIQLEDELLYNRNSLEKELLTNALQKQFKNAYYLSKRNKFSLPLFQISKVNFKPQKNSEFIIEIIVQVKQKIMVNKIYSSKNNRFDLLRHLDNKSQKYSKLLLKNQLFSYLILYTQNKKNKNRDSIPQSLVIESQKVQLADNRNSLQNQFINYSGYTIFINQSIRQSYNSNKLNEQLKLIDLEQNFYIKLYEYINQYFNYKTSYLGNYLQEHDSVIPSQSKQQKVRCQILQDKEKNYYYLIKINTTYYIAYNRIDITQKKIRYFLLYEFSNLISHQKDCIIQEEQELMQGQEFKKNKKYNLVDYFFNKTLNYFNSQTMNHFKHNNDYIYKKRQSKQTSINVSLLNAFQLCFGTIRDIGLADQTHYQSDKLYKVIQSNYRNDIRWKKIDFQFSTNPQYQNFFTFHNSFDYGLLNKTNSKQTSNIKPLFYSFYTQCNHFKERNSYFMSYSYTINRKFQIKLTIFKNSRKMGKHIVKLNQKNMKDVILNEKIRIQQFLLFHLIQDKNTSNILNAYLKKQYVNKLSKSLNMSYSITHGCRPLFTMLKDKKYQVKVFAPFLQTQSTNINKKINRLKQNIYISLQCRTSPKRFSLKITLEQILSQMKQFHRLYSDQKSFIKYLQTIEYFSKTLFNIPKDLLIQKIKFFIGKLQLLKKNTYSQFYFIPVPNLISQAFYKASSIQSAQKKKHQAQWNSLLLNQDQKSLILGALSKLQTSMRQSQKITKTTFYPIKIKNFPTYEIYYKTIKKLIPGYYIIVTIYYVPIFDLSEIKFYFSKIHKSFYICIKKDLKQTEYEQLINIFTQYLKDKFFNKVIVRQSQKLSDKYKQFYSKMIKQAESPFITRTRKNKQAALIPGIQSSNRRIRGNKKIYNLNDIQFKELTQQLLCKVFQSKKNNKYLIRLSYLSSEQYIEQQKRKGIDQTISISIYKQNSMLIYKFQTTARKLLSKKITHKYNVIQLQYQQKSKPFYILFDQIRFLIEQSDQSTYGLLNTFRSYFLNKFYNNLTTNNFISTFSINLLSGISSNFLNSQNSLGQLFSPKSPFQAEKQLNIKDVHSNMYQRFCLFFHKDHMLQVLKIRSSYQNRFFDKSQSSLLSFSKNFEQDKTSSNLYQRSNKRKQSIEAYLLGQDDSRKQKKLKTSIRINCNSQGKHYEYQQGENQLKKKVDFIKQQGHESYHKSSSKSVKKRYMQEQKIVYLINKHTEQITQICSSHQDQGFAINIPFSRYNKKMFKRFFKHLTYSPFSSTQSFSSQNQQNSQKDSNQDSNFDASCSFQ